MMQRIHFQHIAKKQPIISRAPPSLPAEQLETYPSISKAVYIQDSVCTFVGCVSSKCPWMAVFLIRQTFSEDIDEIFHFVRLDPCHEMVDRFLRLDLIE